MQDQDIDNSMYIYRIRDQFVSNEFYNLQILRFQKKIFNKTTNLADGLQRLGKKGTKITAEKKHKLRVTRKSGND